MILLSKSITIVLGIKLTQTVLAGDIELCRSFEIK